MNKEFKKDILLGMQQALLGEIYSNIRAIAFNYHEKNKEFTIRYYVDREPTDDDYESISNVMAEFISLFKHSEFNKLNEECIFINDSISSFDPLKGFIYVRKE